MMVQHTYNNVNTRSDLLPPEQIAQSRSWCLGNSILTILSTVDFKQKIIIRRAAGVTVFETRLLNDVGNDTIESRNNNIVKVMNENTEPITPRSRSHSIDIGLMEQPINRFESKQYPSDDLIANQIQQLQFSDDKMNVDPAFLFLQLQPYPIWQETVFTPITIGTNETITRGIALLDRTPSIDIHKIGIIYVAEGQKLESEILGNIFGSTHYERFLTEIGQLFPLNSNLNIYTGGLDTSDQKLDGSFAICHFPDQRLAQIIFHTTTLMPNNKNDVVRTAKKRHIGNDFVNIIWNEGGSPFAFNTISGQFNKFQAVIEPLYQVEYHLRVFKVSVVCSDQSIYSNTCDLITGSNLGAFVRQVALYSNLMAQVSSGMQTSTTLERLRQIKRIKERLTPTTMDKIDFSQLIL